MDNLNNRSDLFLEKNNYSLNKAIHVTRNKKNKYFYSTIYFENYQNNDNLEKIIKDEIKLFVNRVNLPKQFLVLIVGLGSIKHTADAIGPTTLNYIKANAFLSDLGIFINPRVAILEPGVMGKTGINTKRIVESVVLEIKPNLVILIDSFVTKSIDYLNHTVEITDKGITPGSGIMGLNSEINQKTIKVPVIALGVPSALEIKIKDKNYLLSANDIENYVLEISEVIGNSLNELFK